MALADQKVETVILFAQIQMNFMATSCLLSDIMDEADNTLKTKNREKRFLKKEVRNMLKKSQLNKTMGKWNLRDKLLGHSGVGS